MTIIYRTDGGWGSGKGVNLTPVEVDGNFYDLDGRVTYVEDNPTPAVVPIAIRMEGGLFFMDLSDGTTLGPIVMTMPVPQWRGEWLPSTPYAEMDFFTAPDNGGFGAVLRDHTSAATFDWGALDSVSGLPVYQQLVGGSGTTSGIADLVDVALSGQAADDMLVWDAAASLWRNKTPADVTLILPAFGGSTGSVAGLKGLVPAPAAGDVTAGKVLGAGGVWVVPPGGPGTGSLAGLADVSIVSPVNLSLLQYSSTDGKWHNQTLATLGTGTVTHIDTSSGVSGGPITGTGNISLTPIANQALLANVTGSTAPPAGVSLSTLLDAVVGSGRGSIIRRGATAWTVLTPGADGTFLRSGGPAADITWGVPAGSGTVTQVNSGSGLTGGPITTTGTLSLATVSDKQLLANISGGTAAPAGTTLTLLLDSALGATQGMILYRGASAWSALATGAAGAVLTAHGAGTDPTWVAGTGSGTVTNIATGTGLIGGPITATGTISFATVADLSLLANISGGTAAPTPSTMSAIMDAVFATARGGVLYRGAAGWVALAPGTAGNVLTTGGSGADPSWAAAAAASGGGASGPTTFNPSDKESHITLSGGNLVATGTAGWTGSVRNTASKTSGKYYWECTATTFAQIQSGVGMFAGTVSIAQNVHSSVTGACGVIQNSGIVYVDGSSFFTLGGVGSSSVSFGTITSGTVIGIAVDLTAKLVWFRLGAAGNWNNAAGRDPATGTGGIAIPNLGGSVASFPTVSFGGNDVITGNFGASAFAGTAPSGFATWTAAEPWTVGSVPFATSTTALGQDNANLFYDNANDRLGLGTTSPVNKLEVNGEVTISNNSAYYGNLYFNTGFKYRYGPTLGGGLIKFNNVDPVMVMSVAPSGGNSGAASAATLVDAVQILGNGNVGIGTNNAAVKFHVVGTSAAGAFPAYISSGPNGADTTTTVLKFTDFGNTVAVGQINRNGTNTVAYATSSDLRLKENISDATLGLQELLQIHVHEYTFKGGDTRQEHGLIAQEIATIYPMAAVRGGDDPNLQPWMLDYGRLTPLLIKSIQQQQAQIEKLEDRLAALEGKPQH
jgi:hypothetical protein